MSDQYEPPPGPPPNYRNSSQSNIDRAQQQDARSPQAVPLAGSGGLSSSSQLASNNPFREDHLTLPGGSRPSATNLSPGGSGSRSVQNSPAQPQSQGQGPPSTQTSDTEMGEEDYQPPPGPPPGHKGTEAEDQPPAGPPPDLAGTRSPEPPPYDPWTDPDDNLRPPPSFQSSRLDERSPTANADYEDARRGHAWCRENPLWQPVEHVSEIVERIEAGDVRLTIPPNTTDVTPYFPSHGRSYIRTTSSIGDTIMLSDIPVYASLAQSPLATGRPTTLYFEVVVLGLGDRYNPDNNVESGIGIGFLAPPYPVWRLPGWHRGSLGVFSDDGRRFVDNSYGGKEFTTPFQKGDVVGIGMTFAPPVHGDRVSMRCECFFTRNGTVDGKWELHEEIDSNADEGDIAGLEGHYDLLAAVGVFGSVEFECVFRPDEWRYKP